MFFNYSLSDGLYFLKITASFLYLTCSYVCFYLLSKKGGMPFILKIYTVPLSANRTTLDDIIKNSIDSNDLPEDTKTEICKKIEENKTKVSNSRLKAYNCDFHFEHRVDKKDHYSIVQNQNS